MSRTLLWKEVTIRLFKFTVMTDLLELKEPRWKHCETGFSLANGVIPGFSNARLHQMVAIHFLGQDARDCADARQQKGERRRW